VKRIGGKNEAITLRLEYIDDLGASNLPITI